MAQVSSNTSPWVPRSAQQGTAHLEGQRQSRGTMGPMLMTLARQPTDGPPGSLNPQDFITHVFSHL